MVMVFFSLSTTIPGGSAAATSTAKTQRAQSEISLLLVKGIPPFTCKAPVSVKPQAALLRANAYDDCRLPGERAIEVTCCRVDLAAMYYRATEKRAGALDGRIVRKIELPFPFAVGQRDCVQHGIHVAGVD